MYRCTGYISVFGRCCKTINEPTRQPVKIRKEIRNEEKCAFLKEEFKVQHRALRAPKLFKAANDNQFYETKTYHHKFFKRLSSETLKGK